MEILRGDFDNEKVQNVGSFNFFLNWTCIFNIWREIRIIEHQVNCCTSPINATTWETTIHPNGSSTLSTLSLEGQFYTTPPYISVGGILVG